MIKRRNVAVDDIGIIYITGEFEDSATFGDTSITSVGGTDIFLAKYGTDGEFKWVNYGGGTSTGNESMSIALDEIGEIYVTGRFGGTANFGSSTITSNGGYDIFLVKYSKSGNLKWIKTGGSSSSDTPYGVTVDDSDYVIITGIF